MAANTGWFVLSLTRDQRQTGLFPSGFTRLALIDRLCRVQGNRWYHGAVGLYDQLRFRLGSGLLLQSETSILRGRIRADLVSQSAPIGPNDLMIAAIARCSDTVLVTHNTGEFSRVTGLRLEDWQVP